MTTLAASVLLLMVLALSAAPATMASPEDVVRDCADDGFVEKDRHSRQDLRQGRNRIPADLDAYSDCRAQIDEALDGPRAKAASPGGFPGGDGTGGGGTAGDGSGGSGGPPSGGSERPSAEDQQREAVASERKRRLARADTESLLGERNVNPATAGALEEADTANEISLALLLAMIALVLMLATGTVVALRHRNPELFAGTLGRIPFPSGLASLASRRRRR